MGIIAEAIADIKEKCSGYSKDEHGVWQIQATGKVGRNPNRARKRKLYRDSKEKSKRCGEGQARMIMGLVL